MRKWTFGLIVGAVMGIASVLLIGALNAQTPDAAPVGVNLNALKIIPYANGTTGFFDPQSGKIYLYAANFETCFAVYQLQKLGDPFVKNP
jgi:hypothetical protein